MRCSHSAVEYYTFLSHFCFDFHIRNTTPIKPGTPQKNDITGEV